MSRACDDDNVVINREPTSDSSARSVLFSPLNISILPSPSHSYKSPLSLFLSVAFLRSPLSLSLAVLLVLAFFEMAPQSSEHLTLPHVRARERESSSQGGREGERRRVSAAFQSIPKYKRLFFFLLPPALSLARARCVRSPLHERTRARAHPL